MGGSDDDLLWGEDDHDFLYGGDGGDVIYGGAGDDEIHGGTGNDGIEGDDGNDFIHPGPGLDVVHGGSGDDRVEVRDLCEVFIGETLIGGFGNDTLALGMPLMDLLAEGVIVLGFENIIEMDSSLEKAECAP